MPDLAVAAKAGDQPIEKKMDSTAGQQQAQASVEAAIFSLDSAVMPDRLRRSLTLDLHFIRGALADPVSVLDSAEVRHG